MVTFAVMAFIRNPSQIATKSCLCPPFGLAPTRLEQVSSWLCSILKLVDFFS